MTTEPPLVTNSGRYRLGQAAALLGIHRNTLAAAADRGEIKCSYTKSLRRVFAGQAIMSYWRSH